MGSAETRQERRAKERECQKGHEIETSSQKNDSITQKKRSVMPLVLSGLVGIALALIWVKLFSPDKGGIPLQIERKDRKKAVSNISERARKYTDLLNLDPKDVEGMDIVELNLLCGSDLNGTKDAGIQPFLEDLDAMVEEVKEQINSPSNLERWRKNKPSHEISKSIYKMRVLVATLQNIYDIRYSDSLRKFILTKDGKPVAFPKGLDEKFYSDATNVFLQGLLSEKRQGTCVNMPVLYTAVARRLGYPVYLVMCKGHLFCRWDSPEEKFNIEGSGDGGMTPYPDKFYHTFPRTLTEWDLKYTNYMKSLTPAEELALFLKTRAVCLAQSNRKAEGFVALAQAVRLSQERGIPGLEKQIAIDGFLPERTRQSIEDRFLRRMNLHRGMPFTPHQTRKP